jgi:hypothetical protein
MQASGAQIKGKGRRGGKGRRKRVSRKGAKVSQRAQIFQWFDSSVFQMTSAEATIYAALQESWHFV